MLPLYAPEQVRAMDARAFARGVGEDRLMEHAAGHLARAIIDVAGRGYGLRVGIVCGKGNNGGDGLAAARRLLDAGAAPRICVLDGADALSGLPRVQAERWQARGGRLEDGVEAALADADVVVDCLLGTGVHGPPREPYGRAVEALDRARADGAAVVACDVPTGVDADTGAVHEPCVTADVTLTLGADKAGLWLSPARQRCGQVVVGDIGVDDGRTDPVAYRLTDADAAALLPPPSPSSYKHRRGVVLIVAGSDDMRGAAVLVARGALAGGAGLVTVATTPAARETVATAVPEALTVALPTDVVDARQVLDPHLTRAHALAIGPGLGLEPPTTALVRGLVDEAPQHLVLDADGLNAHAGDPDALASHGSGHLVLTPHAAEYARLLGDDAWADRFATAHEAAASWRATIVAKGPGTLVAAPSGRRWINGSGSGALATGGTGDVLTGLLAATVATQVDPAAVAAAVHVHGRAGEIAAGRGDPRAVSAGDVAAALPAALASLRCEDDRPGRAGRRSYPGGHRSGRAGRRSYPGGHRPGGAGRRGFDEPGDRA